MEVICYGNQDKEWDDFVRDSRNGTIFNLRKFLAYHPPGRFEDHSLLFRDDKGRLKAVLPAAVVGNVLVSHPGASYGGPVVGRAGSEDVFLAVKALVRHTEGRFDAVELRPPPRFCERAPCGDVDYALFRHGFRLDRLPLASVCDLGRSFVFRGDTERSMRKALKEGVKVRQTDKWHSFWKILEKSLRDRHDAAPTHTLEEMFSLRMEFPDEIKLFGAFLDEKLVAGMVTFECNPQALIAFYYATDYDYQACRPLNLVIPRVMEWARDKKYKWLCHGVSTEEGGAVANWGLFRFKEGFGATGVVRKVWRKEL